MSADDLVQFLAQALFVLIFLLVLARAVRHPWRANVDMALLFGVSSLLVAESWLVNALALQRNWMLGWISSALLMALPYLLLRLVDDFSQVPRALMRLAELGLVLSMVGVFLFQPALPAWLTALLVLYFVGFTLYAAVAFVQEARRSSGVTRRRMEAAASGSVFLGLTILLAGLGLGLPSFLPLWTLLSRVCALATGIAYFLGFAPPGFLRRAWQEPELRGFLGRAASLPRLPNTASIIRELEVGAAASTGAPNASIGLWDRHAGVLRFESAEPFELAPGRMIAGRAFAAQQAIFSPDAPRDDPGHAELYCKYGVKAVLAAPITAGDRRLGVLVVDAPRAPIFADDDLELVQLLADQAAVILESRALIDEAARVRAREEATRLKDDFLSAAAHDLKTPLTTLVAQAQLLERRILRDPQAPPDLAGVRRIIQEAKRLSDLVLEVLDAARTEQGRLLGERTQLDLVELARETCERQSNGRHQCLVEATEPVVGEYDRTRIAQLLFNLVENAIKYSPAGGVVRVRVWREGNTARLAVVDQGIGIPAADLTQIFERFQRAANVDDRHFAGMGLGLYICRGIAEQHGGRIWAESPGPGRGSTMHVELPLSVGVSVS